MYKSVYKYSKNGSHVVNFNDIILGLYRIILMQGCGNIMLKRTLLYGLLLLSVFYQTFVTMNLVTRKIGFRIDTLEDLLRPEASHLMPLMRQSGSTMQYVKHPPTDRYRRLQAKVNQFGGADACSAKMDMINLFKYLKKFDKSQFVLLATSLLNELILMSTYTESAMTLLHNKKLYTSKQYIHIDVYSMLQGFTSKDDLTSLKTRYSILFNLFHFLIRTFFVC